MSHFVVVVTNVDEENLESQLEPFYEQGDERDYFMKKEYYVERNKKSINDWLDNEIEFTESNIKDAKDRLQVEKDKDDKELSEKEKEEKQRLIENHNNRINWCTSSLETLKKIKNTKGINKQIDEIEAYEGGGKDSKGLYWLNNPNAKWDWWTEGGRWDRWLMTKWGEGRNRCKVKDLDLDAMRINEMGEAAKYYVMERTRAKENNREMSIWGFDKLPTLDEYVESRNCPVAPFAILHEGEWIEKGDMGWWGISNDKFTEKDWAKKFKEIIDSLDPESEIAIVDCHI